MDNISASISVTASDCNVTAIIGIAAVDGVLLLVSFFGMVLNLILIAALIGKDNSELVLSIRVILINILAACVLGALNSIMYHIAAPILHLVSFMMECQFVSTLASVHGPLVLFCRASVSLSNTSSSGRVLFTSFYGVTVFIAVHFWSRPVLAPRNTKYFIVASAVLWLLAVAVSAPSVFGQSLGGFCSILGKSAHETVDTNYYHLLLSALPYFFVSCIPIVVTPVLLLQTSCYIKHRTIREHRDSKRALVRFGLFLMIVQTFNTFSQIGVPLLVLGIISLQTEAFLAYFIAAALSDLARIPANVLILVFFKPVRITVQRWICCCCHHVQGTSRSGTVSNISVTTIA